MHAMLLGGSGYHSPPDSPKGFNRHVLELGSGRFGFGKRSAIGIRNRGFDPLAILLGKKDKFGFPPCYKEKGDKKKLILEGN